MWDYNRHSISYTGTNMAGKLVSVPFHLLDRLEKCNPNNLDLFLHISCQPYSLLSLANNTCFRHTLSETRQRFNKLYRRKVCTCSNWEFLLIYLINSKCVGPFPDLRNWSSHSPFFVQAHLHHYTQVDGMELDQFTQSLESLDSIVCEYETLEASMGRPSTQVPRLKIA